MMVQWVLIGCMRPSCPARPTAQSAAGSLTTRATRQGGDWTIGPRTAYPVLVALVLLLPRRGEA